jgi:hypothetical protein
MEHSDALEDRIVRVIGVRYNQRLDGVCRPVAVVEV